MNSWYQNQMLRWGVKIISPPLAEPVSLVEARLHLRVDDDGESPPAHPDDPLITQFITVAREWCETYTGRAIAPQVVEIASTAFSNQSNGNTWHSCCVNISSTVYSAYIELPMSPVASIIQVTYIDGNGLTQVVASSDYVLDDYSQPPRLYAASGVVWPTVQATPNAARIRYYAGYDLPGDSPNPNPLPLSFVAAIKLIMGHLYENREQTQAGGGGTTLLHEIPMGVQSLLDPYRLQTGIA